MRIDKYLAEQYVELSRSKIQKLIKEGRVLVNKEKVKVSYEVLEQDKVEVFQVEEADRTIFSEDTPVEILLEEKDYLVLNKPAGMVVHPSETGHFSGTLVNAMFDKIEKGVGESFRPGVVHRLDQDTSGLIVLAKTQKGYEHFVEQFKKRKVKKIYLALAKGLMEFKSGKIDSPIARSLNQRKKMAVINSGKSAVTIYKVVAEFEIKKDTFVSLVEVNLETGRTHQIRVHMAAIGHPVVGDNVYGVGSFNRTFKNTFELDRQFLHAYVLEFVDPGGKKQKIKAPLSKELQNVLDELEAL